MRCLTVAALCMACAPTLELPTTSNVTCSVDTDCPLGRTCNENGRCFKPGDDITPPALSSAVADSSESVVLTFDDLLEPTRAQTLEAYTVQGNGPDGPMSATAVRLESDSQHVTLFTTQQWAGEPYTVTVTGLSDLHANVDETPITGQFDGYGNVDQNPPTLLAPTKGAIVDGGEPIVLSWTARDGARSYEIEVSTTADFSEGVTSYTATADHVSLTIAGGTLAEVIYYWRVHAVGTRPDFVNDPNGVFNVLGATIYVACAAELDWDACQAQDTGAAGNHSTPYGTITGGLNGAVTNLRRVVHVSGRGASAYNEAVELVNGVSLLGGYGTDGVTRDVVANPTIVSSGATVQVNAFRIVDATTIDGFTIVSSNGPILRLTAWGVLITESTSALTVSNCIVHAGTPCNDANHDLDEEFPTRVDYVYGLEVRGALAGAVDAAPHILSNTIVNNTQCFYDNGESYGMRVVGAQPTVQGNTIDGGIIEAVDPYLYPTVHPYGMSIEGTPDCATITGNTVTVHHEVGGCYGCASVAMNACTDGNTVQEL